MMKARNRTRLVSQLVFYLDWSWIRLRFTASPCNLARCCVVARRADSLSMHRSLLFRSLLPRRLHRSHRAVCDAGVDAASSERASERESSVRIAHRRLAGITNSAVRETPNDKATGSEQDNSDRIEHRRRRHLQRGESNADDKLAGSERDSSANIASTSASLTAR